MTVERVVVVVVVITVDDGKEGVRKDLVVVIIVDGGYEAQETCHPGSNQEARKTAT